MAKLIIVIIMFLLAVGSEWLKARKKKAVPNIPHRRATAATASTVPKIMPDRHLQPAKATEAVLFEEGQPSTPRETAKTATAHVGSQAVVSREELRRAVIWSEILKPKF